MTHGWSRDRLAGWRFAIYSVQIQRVLTSSATHIVLLFEALATTCKKRNYKIETKNYKFKLKHYEKLSRLIFNTFTCCFRYQTIGRK